MSLLRWEINRRSFSARAAYKVQHERVRVSAKFRDDEGRSVRHEPGDEMNVAGQPVELIIGALSFCAVFSAADAYRAICRLSDERHHVPQRR